MQELPVQLIWGLLTENPFSNMSSSLCQVTCLWTVDADSNVFEKNLPFGITAANVGFSYNENFPQQNVSSVKYSLPLVLFLPIFWS